MKERIDVLLVRRGFFSTREKAKRAIMAGLVYTQSDRIEKPGTKVDESLQLIVKGTDCPYVSRGGWKLEKAIRSFNLSLENKTVIDIGASTGGFTDCALQHGASIVYAVDVGYGQLDWRLRQDSRVVVMERTNFRYITAGDLPNGPPQVGVVDVSFISLKRILPVLYDVLNEEGEIMTLVKPQFEAGREKVGKKGIVREKRVHQEVLQNVIEKATSIGFSIHAIDYSPVTGGDGNIEFLLYASKRNKPPSSVHNRRTIFDIERVVRNAHHELQS